MLFLIKGFGPLRMEKKLIYFFILFLFILSLSLTIFAKDQKQTNPFKSYITNSPLIFSASIGLIFSFTGMVEMNLGQFYFGQIPINYCFGLISTIFIQSSTFSLALSPVMSVHLGFSSIPLELIEAIGLGVGFEINSEIKPKIAFTALFQVNYYLTNNNGIFIQISSISGYMNWGFGIFFNTVGGKK